jgi:molybdate transport system substrate-binding protein
VNTYPIATIKGTDHADLAKQFVDFVLSDDGRRVLAEAGFAKPLTAG